MRKTATIECNSRLAVDTKELQGMLCCGRDTAVKIGQEAEAKMKFGSRVLWNVAKVQEYLNTMSHGNIEE